MNWKICSVLFLIAAVVSGIVAISEFIFYSQFRTSPAIHIAWLAVAVCLIAVASIRKQPPR